MTPPDTLKRLEEIQCRGKNYDFIDSKIVPVQVSDYLWLLTELRKALAVNQKLAGMINPYHDQDCSDSDEEFGDDECCECGATERARVLSVLAKIEGGE